MKTRPILAFGLFLLLALLSSCDQVTNPAKGSYAIIEQPMQGSFSGQPFTLVSGFAINSYFNPGLAYSLNLYNVAPDASVTNPWDFGAYPYGNPRLQVMAELPVAPGTYYLFLDWSTGESRTVTLYDGTTNIICSDGTIRIDSISATEISGAIAARLNNDWINGTFTVPIAP